MQRVFTDDLSFPADFALLARYFLFGTRFRDLIAVPLGDMIHLWLSIIPWLELYLVSRGRATHPHVSKRQ
jgi:hypothetical protein